jgi:DNA-binding MarR family transcriptional regulator
MSRRCVTAPALASWTTASRVSRAARKNPPYRRAIQISSVGHTDSLSRCGVGGRWPDGHSAAVCGALKGGTDLSPPSREDFVRLLAFRVSLRRFQRWSEDQAAESGLTHVQHQLLVAVKGHPGDIPPSIGELADYLLLRHHSAVELVDRAESAGLVHRVGDAADARVVRVELARKGDRLITELTGAHLDELHKLAAALNELVAAHHQA